MIPRSCFFRIPLRNPGIQERNRGSTTRRRKNLFSWFPGFLRGILRSGSQPLEPNRRSSVLVIGLLLASCGVAETGLLLTVPSSDGGIVELGDVIIRVKEDFGRVPNGLTVSTPIEFENTTGRRQKVDLSSVDGDWQNFSIAGLPAGDSIEVDDVTTLMLEFTAREGSKRALFHFSVCPIPECQVERTVRGTGVEAFACDGTDLGAVEPGGCIEARLVCINETDGELVVDGLTVFGSEEFRVFPPMTAPVPSYTSFVAGVLFCPFERGPREATLEIQSRHPAGRVATQVQLRGEGIGGTGVLECDPSSLELVVQLPNGAAFAQVLCSASKALVIDRAQLRPGMAPGLGVDVLLDGNPVALPIRVDAFSRVDLSLFFSPPFPGEWFETLEVVHSDGIETIDIKASAFESAGCVLDFPQRFDLAPAMVGGVATGQFFLTNVGSAECTVDIFGLSATSDPAFQIQQPPPNSTLLLFPGEQVPIDVAFQPMRPGLHTAEFIFGVLELGMRNAISLNAEGFDQLASYSNAFIPNTPLTAAGGMNVLFPNADDSFVEAPLAFPFEFAGQPASSVWVGTNGNLSFTSPMGMDRFDNDPVPSRMPPNGMIAWWWNDLFIGTMSRVTTSVSGIAPARVQSFGFLQIELFGDPNTAINAEVRLYEQDSSIEVHYGPIRVSTEFDASMGWESVDGLFGADPLGCSPACSSMQWPLDTIVRYTPQ
jgi:hypothetical protein